jgi:hypothetical protein
MKSKTKPLSISTDVPLLHKINNLSPDVKIKDASHVTLDSPNMALPLLEVSRSPDMNSNHSP